MLQVQKMQLQQGKVNTLLKTGLQELKKKLFELLEFYNCELQYKNKPRLKVLKLRDNKVGFND